MTLDTLLIISTLSVCGGVLILEIVQTALISRMAQAMNKASLGPRYPVNGLELPALPPEGGILCRRCGHGQSDHEPIKNNHCWNLSPDACNCKGWLL